MRPVLARRRRSGLAVALLMTLSASLVLALLPAGADATGSAITGAVFDDANRNGIQDPGEAPFSGHLLYLFDGASGQYLATGASDALGRYAFTGLSDGEYRIEYESSSWTVLRNDWVPTTTGSLYPRVFVYLTGSATADFGWRRIVRSTDLSAPVSVYTGANGLRVESFDDAVTARELYDLLAGRSQVGAEAVSTTIRFDAGNQSYTAASVSGAPGSFTGYTAKANMTWQAWLNSGDQVLFHEYGHAWSLYYACLAQPDDTLAGYLQARGLTGDSRLDSSHAWNRRELIAEDYRQLFGSVTAAAAPQENRDIPPAASVPGLQEFLTGAFKQPVGPPPAPQPEPAPTPAPPPALAVSGLSVSPTPVRTSATATFVLSVPSRRPSP
jgi:hypothetical protein